MLRTLLAAALVAFPVRDAPAAVTLTAADGVTIAGAAYGSRGGTAPIVLLFHQAGSGKNEYAPIAPRLVALGYRALAIDQRSGGALYGSNATVERLGHSAPYEAVGADMDAALAYAKRGNGGAPIYAWGSSYSAALVFPFAARHRDDIAAVLAFSPAEYLSDKGAVRAAARHITVPVFLDSASDPTEIRSARAIYDALGSKLKVQYVPKRGVHGSSTLRDDRDAEGASENWNAVTSFLARARQSR